MFLVQALLSTLLLATGPGGAGADTTRLDSGQDLPGSRERLGETRRLEALEVSATRLERSDETSPLHIEAMDERSLSDAAGASPSLAQAIQQLPGVGALGRDGLTSAPTIRGMGRGRSLLIVEGMRLSADRGVGPSGSFLDPLLVQELRLVRGAAGVAYGSGAMGGVMDLGLGRLGNERRWAARVGATTNGDGRLFGLRAEGPLGNSVRGLAAAFHRRADDYDFPAADEIPLVPGDETTAQNSGFESSGAAFAIERTFGWSRLRWAGLASRATDVGRPTTRAGRRDTIGREDHFLTTVRYSADTQGARTQVAAGLHRPWTRIRGERFSAEGQPQRTSSLLNRSWDGTFNALVERPIGSSAASWLAGADVFVRGAADAKETIVWFEGDEENRSETAARIADGWRLDLGAWAGWKRLLAETGEVRLAARVDRASRGAQDRTTVSWVAPSLTAGVALALDESWQWTGLLARSFRGPRIQELYFQGERPGGTRLANANLQPETAWSADSGVRWRRRAWSWEAALWGMLAEDLIVQLPVDGAADTLRYENETRGRLGGIEIRGAWAPEGGAGRFTWAYARQVGRDHNGDPLPDVPAGEMRLRAEWRPPIGAPRATAAQRPLQLWTALRVGAAKTPLPNGETAEPWSSWVGDSDIGGDEVAHRGFARWDVGLRARATSTLEIDLAVDNVLNGRALDRPEDGAYPLPGRSLRIQLNYASRSTLQ